MAVKSFKLGPGTLEFGAGPATDFSCQVTACKINPSENVTSEDAVPVLCGEELPGSDDVTYTATLEFTLLQDLTAGATIDWSWTNKGLTKAFTFIPSAGEARQVTGTVRVAPIAIGGDVKKRNTSDAVWTCPEFPTFEAVPAP